MESILISILDRAASLSAKGEFPTVAAACRWSMATD
jgi:hypothetical protein